MRNAYAYERKDRHRVCLSFTRACTVRPRARVWHSGWCRASLMHHAVINTSGQPACGGKVVACQQKKSYTHVRQATIVYRSTNARWSGNLDTVAKDRKTSDRLPSIWGKCDPLFGVAHARGHIDKKLYCSRAREVKIKNATIPRTTRDGLCVYSTLYECFFMCLVENKNERFAFS